MHQRHGEDHHQQGRRRALDPLRRAHRDHGGARASHSDEPERRRTTTSRGRRRAATRSAPRGSGRRSPAGPRSPGGGARPAGWPSGGHPAIAQRGIDLAHRLDLVADRSRPPRSRRRHRPRPAPGPSGPVPSSDRCSGHRLAQVPARTPCSRSRGPPAASASGAACADRPPTRRGRAARPPRRRRGRAPARGTAGRSTSSDRRAGHATSMTTGDTSPGASRSDSRYPNESYRCTLRYVSRRAPSGPTTTSVLNGSVVGRLEHAGDDRGTETTRVAGQHRDERAVQRFGHGRQIVARLAEVVHRALGQDAPDRGRRAGPPTARRSAYGWSPNPGLRRTEAPRHAYFHLGR